MITKELTERTVVRPPEDGIKDHPSLPIEVAFRVAAVKVPDIPTDVVRAWPITTSIVDVGAQSNKYDDVVVSVQEIERKGRRTACCTCTSGNSRSTC
jgi:hypothetical protein